MCIQDLQLGRGRSYRKTIAVGSGVGVVQVLKGDAKRVGIIITGATGAAPAGTYMPFYFGDDPLGIPAIAFKDTDETLFLDIERYGTLITGGLVADTTGWLVGGVWVTEIYTEVDAEPIGL